MEDHLLEIFGGHDTKEVITKEFQLILTLVGTKKKRN